MAELSKEHFDKVLEKLATKDDLKGLATKNDLQTAFVEFWEGNLEPAFNRIHDDVGNLDERLTIVERKLDKALYKETERITNLENEMKVVKEKLGIK